MLLTIRSVTLNILSQTSDAPSFFEFFCSCYRILECVVNYALQLSGRKNQVETKDDLSFNYLPEKPERWFDRSQFYVGKCTQFDDFGCRQGCKLLHIVPYVLESSPANHCDAVHALYSGKS